MTPQPLQALYAEIFADGVREPELEVRAATDDGVTLALPGGQVAAHATSTSALL